MSLTSIICLSCCRLLLYTPCAAGGQSWVAGDARVEPWDSGTLGDSSATEAPEESVDAPLGQVEEEMERPYF